MKDETRRALFARIRELGIEDGKRKALAIDLFGDHGVDDSTGEGTIRKLSDAEGQLFYRYLLATKRVRGRLIFPDVGAYLAKRADWIQMAGMKTVQEEDPNLADYKLRKVQEEQSDFDSEWFRFIDQLPPDPEGVFDIDYAPLKMRQSALLAAKRLGITPERATSLLEVTAKQQGNGAQSWSFLPTMRQLRAFNKMLRSIKLPKTTF